MVCHSKLPSGIEVFPLIFRNLLSVGTVCGYLAGGSGGEYGPEATSNIPAFTHWRSSLDYRYLMFLFI